LFSKSLIKIYDSWGKRRLEDVDPKPWVDMPSSLYRMKIISSTLGN
jgi:hypothetical protein